MYLGVPTKLPGDYIFTAEKRRQGLIQLFLFLERVKRVYYSVYAVYVTKRFASSPTLSSASDPITT